MAAPDTFRDFVLDQLERLRGVDCKAMFGGHGLYCNGVFFGIISEGRLYLKTDENSKRKHIDAGMGPFRASEKQTLITYYEVPVDVLEDAAALAEWAREAIACQTIKGRKR